MSKGSRPRPFSISQDELADRYDTIFGVKPKKEPYIPPPLPDMTKDKSKVEWVSDTTNKEQQ